MIILEIFFVIAVALFILIMALRATDEAANQRLADRLEKATLATFLPFGTGMMIAGFIVPTLRHSFLSFGFTTMGMGVLLLIQSQLRKRIGAKALSLTRRVRILREVVWWVTLLAGIVLLLGIPFIIG